MRVTLGGFEHAALMLDQGGAPRPFDDVTQIGAGNPLARAPELIKHTIHGPPQIWEHRIPLSAVYASSDLYAVAATICSLLVTPSSQSEQAIGDDPSELLSRLPDWLSPALSALLKEMLNPSPEKRPPIRAALLRVAMLLFGPHPDEMKSQLDCEMWLTSQAMRLLLSTPTDQHEKPMPGMHGCREAQDRLDWVLCRDYILNITPLQLWQLYQKYQMT
ncbi:uncharacterized protein [Diadema antillarum]|uniref:uncharacterized protein n=1 Tax=Diadema antillarum TaxID=105358 RepID=UPI003A8B1059